MKCLVLIILFVINQTMLGFNIDFKQFERLLNDEKQVINSLKNYINSEENKLDTIQQFVDNYDENAVPDDNSDILENPIHTYLAIKRLTVKWNGMFRIFGSQSLLFDRNFTESLKTFNISIVFDDAVETMHRITLINNLDVKLLAQGIIKYVSNLGETKTIITSQRLTAFDCYLIGSKSYSFKELSRAKVWLEEALRLEAHDEIELRTQILGKLSQTCYKLGEKSKAFDYMKQSLTLSNTKEDDMVFTFALNSLLMNDQKLADKILMDLTADKYVDYLDRDAFNSLQVNVHNMAGNDLTHDKFDEEQEKFYSHTKKTNELCGRKRYSTERIDSTLKCYYLNTTGRPYLRLTRIYVEELHKMPQILFFHKFITESEIETLHNLTKTKLSPKVYYEPNRVSQNYLLYNNASNVAEAITRRIGAVTELDMTRATPGYIHKYSTGGLYKDHYDGGHVNSSGSSSNATDPRFKKLDTLATVLLYWNDVEAGGQTYFPLLNLTVWPERGGAILWFNYKRSGQPDDNMLHGSCPILIGLKYITFKGISFAGQEFIRPCSLNPDELNINR